MMKVSDSQACVPFLLAGAGVRGKVGLGQGHLAPWSLLSVSMEAKRRESG